MLIYGLALAVGLGSLILFSTAFFLPKLHRRDDFFWSSVGLFYALSLWVCRESFRGGVLLGQVAACALLFSLGWQMWRLRVLNPDVEEFSLLSWLQESLFPQKKPLSTPLGEKGEKISAENPPIVEEILETPIVEEILENQLPKTDSQLLETPVAKVVESTTTEKGSPTQKKGKFGFLGGIFKKNPTLREENKARKKPSLVEELEGNEEEEAEEIVTDPLVIEEILEPIAEETQEAIQTVTELVVPETQEATQTVTELVVPEIQEATQTVTELVVPEIQEATQTVTELVVPETQETTQTVTELVVPDVEETTKTVIKLVVPEGENATKTVTELVVSEGEETTKTVIKLVVPEGENATKTVTELVVPEGEEKPKDIT